MAVRRPKPDPEASSEQDRRRLRRLYAALAATPAVGVTIDAGDGGAIELPDEVGFAVRELVRAAADGQPAAVVPGRLRLTTEQAADLLDLAHGDLLRLLETGAVRAASDGAGRSILLTDLMGYKRRRDAERRQALDDLARLHGELGLYERT